MRFKDKEFKDILVKIIYVQMVFSNIVEKSPASKYTQSCAW